jgi:putative ABC transport system substrate-binding protein
VSELQDVQSALHAIGHPLIVADATSAEQIEPAFVTFQQSGARTLFCGTGAFLNSHRERIVDLAARQKLPASYALREFVLAGGLMSYGTSITRAYWQAGFIRHAFSREKGRLSFR